MGLNSPQKLSHQCVAFPQSGSHLTKWNMWGLDAGDKLFWVKLHEMEQWDYRVHAQVSGSPLFSHLLFISLFTCFCLLNRFDEQFCLSCTCWWLIKTDHVLSGFWSSTTSQSKNPTRSESKTLCDLIDAGYTEKVHIVIVLVCLFKTTGKLKICGVIRFMYKLNGSVFRMVGLHWVFTFVCHWCP